MKLVTAPLTEEDERVWAAIVAREPWVTFDEFWPSVQQSDRRDADLMYVLSRVQMQEEYDSQTWVRGGPDGDFVRIRPAALLYVDSHL